MATLKTKAIIACSVVALIASCPAFAETIVLRGARVMTMDSASPEADAVAIVDGRIAAVGSASDMKAHLKGAKIYDLPADALVLPGFQDSHNHLIWSATEAEDISLADVTDAESLKKALDGRLDNLVSGAWVRGGGWDIAAFPGPTAAMLDELTGARPAYFSSSDGHSGWANSAALKLAGIDGADDAPEGGRIEVDAAGKPTGLLRESAMEKVVDLMPDYPEAQVDTGFEKAQAEAHSYGVTALIDPSASEWMLKGYQRADAAGKMTMKVNAAVKIEADAGAAGVGDVLKLKQQYYGPHFEVNAVKLFVDGVIETTTAALLAPYVGSDKSGDLLFTPQQLNDIATAADKAGLQLHAHAIGDRATRVTLDAFQAAQTANGVRDSRHQITHLELIDPADIDRFQTLGVIANIQALWAYPDSYITDLTEPKIGPERSQWLYPFAALKKAGATLAGASDWSVSSMNPLEAIQTGVTRQDIEDANGRVLTPQHRLDVMDMIAAYTVNGAYAAFDETESGTLTAGKRADMVVLARDISKIPPTEIAATKVLLTLADGRAVFVADALPKPKLD